MVRIPYGTPTQESMEFVYLTISILGLWNKWTLFRISSIWVIILLGGGGSVSADTRKSFPQQLLSLRIKSNHFSEIVCSINVWNNAITATGPCRLSPCMWVINKALWCNLIKIGGLLYLFFIYFFCDTLASNDIPFGIISRRADDHDDDDEKRTIIYSSIIHHYWLTWPLGHVRYCHHLHWHLSWLYVVGVCKLLIFFS